jgi:ABC-2 type transport system ATP-binding protein
VDPQTRAFLLERIREQVRAGSAILYATHYMEEVCAVCSHILLLDHGRVLASGDLSTLLGGPKGGEPFHNLEALFMHYTQRSLSE